MTGSSVNFKAVKSAGHAVSHASREVAPTYLLPADKSMGTVVVLDDAGKVSQILEAKMALASPRAKVDKRYSPVWEGILNLRRPEPGEDAEEYRSECSAVVTDWYKQYEAATGHKVLRVDVHLDEGHMVDGEAVLNAHAHVIADRTNDLGRVIKLSPKQLRELQTMTSEVTSLERGKSSFETGRKHINHHAYKHLAERGRLETQQVKVKLDKEIKLTIHNIKEARTAKAEVLDLKGQIAELKAQYKLEREALKASGEATQQAYQALKKAHENAIAALTKANQKVETMTNQITQLEADKDQLAKDLAQAQRAAVLAENYQADRAKGTPGHLIVPDPIPRQATKTAQEQPETKNPDIPTPSQEKTLLEAFLALYAGVRRVALDVIDGCRLDAACGRVGVFSWPSSQRGQPRHLGLCEVPEGKVMPAVGQVFDKRAVPGQEGGVGL
jgi:outer membrane murein-binding lipoprotein Lpp